MIGKILELERVKKHENRERRHDQVVFRLVIQIDKNYTNTYNVTNKKHRTPPKIATKTDTYPQGQLLPESKVMTWFVQTALGLHYMHTNRILHRDIKTQNVFILSSGRVVLGDLGISKVRPYSTATVNIRVWGRGEGDGRLVCNVFSLPRRYDKRYRII